MQFMCRVVNDVCEKFSTLFIASLQQSLEITIF